MRILIVTATKPGSSRAPAEAFVRHVKEAFKKALRAHEKVETLLSIGHSRVLVECQSTLYALPRSTRLYRRRV